MLILSFIHMQYSICLCTAWFVINKTDDIRKKTIQCLKNHMGFL